MKSIIKIEIRPFHYNSSNEIEHSKSNKLLNDIINKITNELKCVDTSEFYFKIKIDSED
jgi:hypothetical protein